MKYSHRHQHNEKHTNIALDQPSQHENTSFIIQDVPVKVKRNVAKWRAKNECTDMAKEHNKISLEATKNSVILSARLQWKRQ